MSDAESLYGKDLFGNDINPPSRGPIADSFIVPPFSVLNAREGFWQDRKRAWLKYGIKGDEGRGSETEGDRLLLAKSSDTQFYIKKREKEAELGRKLTTQDFSDNYYEDDSALNKGTSIFDPVLCELAYKWFCKEGGTIIDPFAGGSVRGIVAAILGYSYWGCDLRAEQVAANMEQGEEIIPSNRPIWVTGDALDMVGGFPEADFIFSCPPYGNLEVYSDDPKDISNMDHDSFLGAYNEIIARTCLQLKNNRFACFVVGDFRNKKGFYRNFVSDTIAAFKKGGLELYNEAILVTAVGSLSMRINRQFSAGRKLGKSHQNILVFVKGDPRKWSD